MELAVCSNNDGSSRWECLSSANMLNLRVPQLKNQRGRHSRDGDQVEYKQAGYCSDDCASDEEDEDRASVEDDVLGKLTKGKLNFVETFVDNDIHKLKATLSPVCCFGLSLIG